MSHRLCQNMYLSDEINNILASDDEVNYIIKYL